MVNKIFFTFYIQLLQTCIPWVREPNNFFVSSSFPSVNTWTRHRLKHNLFSDLHTPIWELMWMISAIFWKTIFIWYLQLLLRKGMALQGVTGYTKCSWSYCSVSFCFCSFICLFVSVLLARRELKNEHQV